MLKFVQKVELQEAGNELVRKFKEKTGEEMSIHISQLMLWFDNLG